MTVLDAAQAFGALIASAADKSAAANVLARYLEHPAHVGSKSLAEVGVSVELAKAFRTQLAPAIAERPDLPDLALAWCAGRASVKPVPMWYPVVTVPEEERPAFEHFTAETFVGLVMGARREIRIFGSFLDTTGIQLLMDPIAMATGRGVSIALGIRAGADKDGSIPLLRRRVAALGDSGGLSVFEAPIGSTYPHLKLLIADDQLAYLGSANLTGPALSSNIEIGAVIEGPGVRRLVELFDRLRTQAKQPDAALHG